MVRRLVKKISKGSRFNQIYLKKNEGLGFEDGNQVLITPLSEALPQVELFEYHVKLDKIKKEIVTSIITFIDQHGTYENVLITGSFLHAGFQFEDIDIVILDPRGIDETSLSQNIAEVIGIQPHLILIESKKFMKGIRTDPLFLLMVERYVSVKRTFFRKDSKVNYKLMDLHLIKHKNLVDGFDFYTFKERKKLLRDFISIKLFVEHRAITKKNIEVESERIFGKKVMENLFVYGQIDAQKQFLKKFKNIYEALEDTVIDYASKQK